MGRENLYPIPPADPVSGGELHVTELSCDSSGTVLRGRFAVPRYARLDAEQTKFLETFLRCRGMLNAVERELGISYPTVKSRLDSLLQALDLTPIREESPRKDKSGEKKREILDKLERGQITPQEAKAMMKEAGS